MLLSFQLQRSAVLLWSIISPSKRASLCSTPPNKYVKNKSSSCRELLPTILLHKPFPPFPRFRMKKKTFQLILCSPATNGPIWMSEKSFRLFWNFHGVRDREQIVASTVKWIPVERIHPIQRHRHRKRRLVWVIMRYEEDFVLQFSIERIFDFFLL